MTAHRPQLFKLLRFRFATSNTLAGELCVFIRDKVRWIFESSRGSPEIARSLTLFR